MTAWMTDVEEWDTENEEKEGEWMKERETKGVDVEGCFLLLRLCFLWKEMEILSLKVQQVK